MKKVDETINAMCDWIQKELGETNTQNCDGVSKMVTALADLISARATAVDI